MQLDFSVLFGRFVLTKLGLDRLGRPAFWRITLNKKRTYCLRFVQRPLYQKRGQMYTSASPRLPPAE